ncbi:MAG: hypothetical protein AAGB51_02960 [Planctomycetota bacterium]
MNRFAIAACGIAAFAAATQAQVVNGFTEDFNSGTAAWLDNIFAPVIGVSSGGPDGSAYISAGADFSNSGLDDTVVLFRGEAGPTAPVDASGGGFVGDYFAAGITELTFSVRHDAAAPVQFFTRFATPNRFPGTIIIDAGVVNPNQWTDVTISILGGPDIVINEGPPSVFNQVFSDVGLVQIGAVVNGALAGQSGFTFDLDNVRVTPTPGAAVLLGFGALAARRRRA